MSIDGITEIDRCPTVTVVAAPYGPRTLMHGTSQTTYTIDPDGPATFLVNEVYSGFTVGMRVRVADSNDPTVNFIEGPVLSETVDTTGQTLTMDVDLVRGGGTFSDWLLNLTGEVGAKGDRGDTGPEGPQGIITDPPNDGIRYVRRKNLGTATWVDADATYQPKDNELTAISGLTGAADSVPYFTGPGAAALMVVTGAARTLLDDTTVAAMRTTLGVQALDADLTSLAGASATGGATPGSGTPTGLYYRKAADTWTPLKMGSGITLDAASDTISVTAGGGNVSTSGTITTNDLAQWASSNTIKSVPIATVLAGVLTNPTISGVATFSGGTTQNNIKVQGNVAGSYPQIYVDNASVDAAVGMAFSTKASAPYNFYSNNFGTLFGQLSSTRFALLSPLTLGSLTSPTGCGLELVSTSLLGGCIDQGVYSADASGPIHYFDKSRGTTIGAFAAVAANDYLGIITFRGADAGAWRNGPSIYALASGAPTTTGVPSFLQINVGKSDGSSVAAMFIRPTGVSFLGTTTNDAAGAGVVGEIIESHVSNNAAIGGGGWTNGTAITLTPGDWDVCGSIAVAGIPSTCFYAAFSQSSGTPGGTSDTMATAYASPNGDGYCNCGPYRYSVAVNTPIYVMCYLMTNGTLYQSHIRARRMR